ncbi:hypothetical protein PoB_005241900 [Plakobranchus ocellatus]|uniref:Uncharacterized protein n=1 Tax=Plakobranchus ocellatus TaxID=259542 RepID=A0AAV4C457_9GAST|nr:hypothetical protein PoB_005241900 [Plakobranchus ocellatus]
MSKYKMVVFAEPHAQATGVKERGRNLRAGIDPSKLLLFHSSNTIFGISSHDRSDIDHLHWSNDIDDDDEEDDDDDDDDDCHGRGKYRYRTTWS